MTHYSIDDFNVDKIEEKYPELFMQKETLEFQLDQYQKNFDSFKKMFYEAMLVYERKKVQNPNLIPDKVVLQQIKALENDPAVKEFRQSIDKLKRELKNVTTQIDNLVGKITKMFEFKEQNCMKYFTAFNEVLNKKLDIDLLMEDIFNNEFNDRSLYYELKYARNYEVIGLMVLNAPASWNTLMNDIMKQLMIMDTIKQIEIMNIYMMNYPIEYHVYLENEYNLKWGVTE